ncbi:helix-turn-helix transcriptional regulator [Actinosynnema sp. NPDC051121]
MGKLIERGLEHSDVADRAELAARCGVHRSYITKLSSGQVQYPRDRVLTRLAEVLNQDPEDYRVAVLMDRTKHDSWVKFMVSEIALHEGVRLSSAETAWIRQCVRDVLVQRKELAKRRGLSLVRVVPS